MREIHVTAGPGVSRKQVIQACLDAGLDVVAEKPIARILDEDYQENVYSMIDGYFVSFYAFGTARCLEAMYELVDKGQTGDREHGLDALDRDTLRQELTELMQRWLPDGASMAGYASGKAQHPVVAVGAQRVVLDLSKAEAYKDSVLGSYYDADRDLQVQLVATHESRGIVISDAPTGL